MIILRDISKSYNKGKQNSVEIFKNLNLKLPDKGFVVILGKSGSGKSTLLNILGGLDRYDEGEIIIGDKSTKNFTNSDWDAYRNTFIGFVFQEFYLIDRFTVGENIALALELQEINKNEVKNKVQDILKQVELPNYESRKVSEISGGEKQRIAIARALVKNPRIILADEPTGNLDSETSKSILDILKRLSEDKLVIMVTHDREFANQYADRIIEIKDGLIIDDNRQEEKITDSTPVSLTKSVLSFKSIFRFALNSFFTKKIRLILMLFLFSLSLGFVGMASSISFYNVSDSTMLTFKKTGTIQVPIVKLPDQNASVINQFISFEQSDLNKYQSDYPSIDFVKSYTTESKSMLNLGFTPRKEFDSSQFTKVTIIDQENQLHYALSFGDYPKQVGDILITDYMAEMMISYEVFGGVVTEKDLVGVEFQENFYSPVFKITGIVETDYHMFDHLREADEMGFVNTGFREQRFEIYGQMFMSEESFVKAYNQECYFILDYNTSTSYSYIGIIPSTRDIYSDILLGTLPVNDNELVISVHALDLYFDEIIMPAQLTTEEIKQYLNREIDIDLSYYGRGIEKFKIVGIFNGDVQHRFMFTKNQYDFFSENNRTSSGRKMLITAFLGSNQSENRQFIDSLTNTNFKHDTLYSWVIYVLQDIVNKTKNVAYIIGAIFALFSSVMIFTFIMISIQSKQKEIGILRALGSKGKDIFKIFGFESLLILIISNIVGFILAYFYIINLNSSLVMALNLKIQLLYVNIYSVLFTIGLSIVIMIISTLYPLLKVTYMPPINTIRKIE